VIEIADMQHPIGQHVVDRPFDARIIIAERIDGDASHQVKIGLAVAVIERAAFASFQHKRGAPIDAQHMILLHFDNRLLLHRSPPSMILDW